ncbi:MAG TPA: class I SAM-dependent methyltransferase [Symbiobacteriaceae bacterium]|nr:class I SAM-dependent methyltransferase [Symbiobacteriaceae bacterium]
MADNAEPIRWNDVADLYDSYVRVTFDVPFLVGEARKTGGEVLELMCGTGRVSLPLVEAGVRLTCVDNAPEMLRQLSDKLGQRGLSANLRLMDVRELDLPQKFALIMIPFHAFAELTSEEDQRRALMRIHAHLVDGGRFICTLHNPPVRLKPVDGIMRLWGSHAAPGGEGRLLLWGAETRDAEAGVVNGVEVFELYDRSGHMESKRLLEFRFRLLERAQFERLAADAGFVIEALFGGYSYEPFDDARSRFLVYVLRK